MGKKRFDNLKKNKIILAYESPKYYLPRDCLKRKERKHLGKMNKIE